MEQKIMARATLDPAKAFGRHPLQPHQLLGRVTRIEDTIVLCHLGVPRIDAGEWSLTVDGLVQRPMRLTLDDLVRRSPTQITSIHQCCGNPLKAQIPTRRICNVVWSGVSLSELLADCKPDPVARYVWSSGADYGTFEGDVCDAFVKDLPLDRAGDDVLIAYEMNGSPLRPENGYPVRLVVPGYYGTNSVKWLNRLTLAEARATGPFTTRWYNDPVQDAIGTADRHINSRLVDCARVGDRFAGTGSSFTRRKGCPSLGLGLGRWRHQCGRREHRWHVHLDVRRHRAACWARLATLRSDMAP